MTHQTFSLTKTFHYTCWTITCVAKYFHKVFYQSTQIIYQLQLPIVTVILIEIENRHKVKTLTLPDCTTKKPYQKQKDLYSKVKNCSFKNLRHTSAKHKQYQAFPPDRRHKGNQSKVEEKRETLETYVIEAIKLTLNIGMGGYPSVLVGLVSVCH